MKDTDAAQWIMCVKLLEVISERDEEEIPRLGDSTSPFITNTRSLKSESGRREESSSLVYKVLNLSDVDFPFFVRIRTNNFERFIDDLTMTMV